MHPLTRRDFVLLSTGTALGSFLGVGTAESFVPFLLRFLLRGLLIRGIREGLRELGSDPSAPDSREPLDLARGWIVGPEVVSVSAEVAAKARAFDVKVLWLDKGVENRFEAALNNEASDPVTGSLTYAIQDVESREIDGEFAGGIISAPPREPSRFPFDLRNLPGRGVKRIIGWSDHPAVTCEPSPRFLVVSKHDLEFRS